MNRSRAIGAALAGAALLTGAVAAAAQDAGDPITFGGLLRTGLRIDPEETGRTDGFEIFDARVNARGEVGLVFDYFIQADYDTDERTFRLLDATATLPVVPEFEITLGLFRPQFGLEALQPKGDLTFLERSQAATAIAPGRQVGIGFDGSTFDGRLTYGGGLFNGNGSTLENDGDDFMFSARAVFNSIGTIAFYDDFAFQIGASFAHSKDTAAPLGRGVATADSLPGAAPDVFAGDRTLFGADVEATYRAWRLTGEYYGADYSPVANDPLPDDADASGGYVEAGVRPYGVVELVTRYDAFSPAVGEDREFLLFGLNVYPGTYAKFTLQYAVGLDDPAPAPDVAANQFIFFAQLDF